MYFDYYLRTAVKYVINQNQENVFDINNSAFVVDIRKVSEEPQFFWSHWISQIDNSSDIKILFFPSV